MITQNRHHTVLCLFFGLLVTSCTPVASSISTGATVTAVPSATLSAAGTPQPPTVTAVANTVSPTTSPTVYTDVWVSGYVYGNRMQVGNASGHVPVTDGFDISIQAADERVAAQLAALPPGDVLVVLDGDLTPAPSARTGHLLVKNVQLVNLPSTPDTPLDATYSHADPAFRIDYPAGWFVEVYDDGQLVLITNAPPDSVSLRPGREHVDPTEVDVGIHVIDTGSIDDYVVAVGGSGETEVEIGGRVFTRIVLAGQGTFYQYVTRMSDRIVVFSVRDYNVSFVERLLETLR